MKVGFVSSARWGEQQVVIIDFGLANVTEPDTRHLEKDLVIWWSVIKPIQCEAPKRYVCWFIAPSNYGYNYHKP